MPKMPKPKVESTMDMDNIVAAFERVLPMVLTMIAQSREAEREFELKLLSTDREYALERLKIMSQVEEEPMLDMDKIQTVVAQVLASMAARQPPA